MNLRQSKRVFKKLLIHRCDVFSKKRVRVGTQWLERFVRVEHNVKCRLSTLQRQNTDYQINLQQEFITPYVLYSFPMNIKQDDRILFKGQKNSLKQWYEVKTIPRNPSFLDHHYESPVDTLGREYSIIEEDGVVYLHE